MVSRCILTFGTSLDTLRTMSISEPQENLDRDIVSDAAADIIEARVHDEEIGTLTNLLRADIISTDTKVLF